MEKDIHLLDIIRRDTDLLEKIWVMCDLDVFAEDISLSHAEIVRPPYDMEGKATWNIRGMFLV